MRRLDLCRNAIGRGGAKHLAGLLRVGACPLTHLLLDGNGIGLNDTAETGVVELAEAIDGGGGGGGNGRLAHLSLARNYVKGAGAAALLEHVIARRRGALAYLDLGHNTALFRRPASSALGGTGSAQKKQKQKRKVQSRKRGRTGAAPLSAADAAAAEATAAANALIEAIKHGSVLRTLVLGGSLGAVPQASAAAIAKACRDKGVKLEGVKDEQDEGAAAASGSESDSDGDD